MADVAVASYIKYAQLFFRTKFGAFPNVERFMADVESRDHFKNTVGGG